MRFVAIILLMLLGLPVSGQNLIRNSSFEVGGSGWITFGSPSSTQHGIDYPLAEHIVNTNGVGRHGAYAMWFRNELVGPPVYLTNGTYTHTFEARGNSSISAGIVQTYLVAVIPPDSFSVTASWQSFTNTFTAPTNGWYCPRYYSASTPGEFWIDKIQLTRGSTAEPYAPAAVIEVGMDTADSGNSLFLSDSKTLRFKLWNNGAQTNASVAYQITGLWNTNLATGFITTNALAANTNTTINFTLPSFWGWQRAVCYVTNINNTWSETTISVFPYAAGVSRDTNSLLGVHSQFSPYHLRQNRQIGFGWTRVFSPLNQSRWTNVFPASMSAPAEYSPGVWHADFQYLWIGTNILEPFTPLAPQDHEWWVQTNASRALMIADYVNYTTQMVHRYKGTNKYWEIFNEPQQNDAGVTTIPRHIMAPYYGSNYAWIATNAAVQIRLFDPNAIIIGFGGYNSADQGWDAWTNMMAFSNYFSALSFHLYPQDQLLDPNLIEDDNVYSSVNVGSIARKFKGIKPLWNTETAGYGVGGYHGINMGFVYPFRNGPLTPAWTSVAWYNELNNRAYRESEVIAINFLRCIGWGFSHYNLQNAASITVDQFGFPHPTIYELNNTVKPEIVALTMANHFIKTPGLGRGTNSTQANAYYIELYMHTNSLGSVMTGWSNDRTNRTLTLAASSSYPAVYDLMGNPIQSNSPTVLITRSPRIFVSGSLTIAQLSNALCNATYTLPGDTIAPGLTIDFSPVGRTTEGVGITNLFTWTPIEETTLSWASITVSNSMTNVLSRWSFDEGSTWTDWNQSNHVYRSFSDSTLRRITVQSKDKANNTTTASGPYFGDFSGVLTTNAIFAITNPLPLTQMVQVVRFTIASNAYDTATTALFDSSGNFVPYQQGSSNQIFFRAGLTPNSTQTWTLVSGIAPTNVSGVRGYIGLSTNTSATLPYGITMTNGLHTGARVALPNVTSYSNAAPIQGFQLRNGHWVNGESGTNGTNFHYVSKDEDSVPPVRVCWSNMTVTVVDAGPIYAELLFEGNYRRSEFNYLGSIEQWPASPGLFKCRVMMNAQEPAVIVENFNNDAGYYRFDVSPGMAADEFRYRGHSASSDANGVMWGFGGTFNDAPYSFDLINSVAFGATNLASRQQNEFGNDTGIFAASYNFPLFIRDAGLWNLMCDTNSAVGSPTLGFANIRQSVGLGGVVSANSPRLGAWSTNNGKFGIEFGTQVYADTTTPQARQLARARWMIYMGTNGSIINSSNHPGYIQPEIMPLFDRHYALDIDKIKLWNLGWSESLAPGGFYMAKASVLTNYTTPIKGGDTALYDELKLVSSTEGDLILDLWLTNSSTAATSILNRLIYTAEQTFNLYTNWLTGDANQASRFNSLQGIAQTLVRAAPVLDAILGDGNATATISNQVKAWVAMNGHMVRDNDVTPIDNYVSNVVNLGTANMVPQYIAARATYSNGFTNHPGFGTNAFADYLSSSNTLTTIINAYGASIGSPHYAGASIQPIYGNLLQARVRGWTNALYGRLQSHADWNIQNSTPIDPRFDQSELVVFGHGYPSANGMNGMLAGAFYSGVDDARASKLLYRWAQEDKPTSDYFFPSFLMIPRNFAQTAYTLRSERTQGYWSVHRDRADSTNHSAFWLINGSYYSDHRIAPDTGNYNWYPLGVPASVGWGSIYYPEVSSQVFGNVWVAADTFPSWTGSNVYTEGLSWTVPQGEQTNFLSFTRATWSDSHYTNNAVRWARNARTFTYFRNASILEVNDTKNNASNFIWTSFLMSTGVVTTPVGTATPVLVTNDTTGTRNMPLVSALAGSVDMPLAAGTNLFGFIGVPWVLAASNGNNFLLATHSPTTNQATIAAWSHAFVESTAGADYVAANGGAFIEQQQILRIKGTNNVRALLLAYRKNTVAPNIITNSAGDWAVIQGQEVQLVNTNYSEYSEGVTNRALVHWSTNTSTLAATNGITITGGPVEVVIGSTNSLSISVNGGAAGVRTIQTPKMGINWPTNFGVNMPANAVLRTATFGT